MAVGRASEPAQPPGPGLVAWSGGAPPALVLSDLAGRRVALAGFRGKVVVVSFWATWCEPCRQELPSLVRLKDRFPAGALHVLTVDVAESRARVRDFLGQVGVVLPVLFDPDGASSRAWGVVGLPTSFVLGRDGRIAYHFVGELEWDREDVVQAVASLVASTPTSTPRAGRASRPDGGPG